ncbi:MAG: hypothetical protein JWO40_388 [Candidatus Doudnabacteria bacterium]|nr:hypothetical protein [Candidatus Doudnabacteria bacterium]
MEPFRRSNIFEQMSDELLADKIIQIKEALEKAQAELAAQTEGAEEYVATKIRIEDIQATLMNHEAEAEQRAIDKTNETA